MQDKTKGETKSTFRRQIRFPKLLIQSIENECGCGNFSRWVISACEQKLSLSADTLKKHIAENEPESNAD